MSLELFNPTTSISRIFSRPFWELTLQLAHGYGWRPQGTHLPGTDGLGWLGSYLSNDGQTVSTEDAHALARALEQALDDIPDESLTRDWNPRTWREEELPEWLSPEEQEFMEAGLEEYTPDVLGLQPFEFFAGAEKEHLLRLIRFCKLGSFMIL